MMPRIRGMRSPPHRVSAASRDVPRGATATRRVASWIALLWTLLPGAAGAGLQLSAAPMKLAVPLDPGERKTSVVEIRNKSAVPVRLVATVSDWFATRDGAMEFAPSGTLARSAHSWISPDLSEFTVPPRGSRVVRVSLSLPDSANGSYWAVLFFEGESSGVDHGLGIGVRARLGVTIYLTAIGTESREDVLTGMDAVIGSPGGDVRFGVSLANRGNVHHYPSGWLQVMGPRGETLFEERVPHRVLLPGHETLYRLSWKPTVAGELRLITTFDVGLETLIQGVKTFVVPSCEAGEPAVVQQQAPEVDAGGQSP